MEISEKLLCLFNAEVTVSGDSYVVEVPRREVETGTVDPGETYRVALIARESAEGEAGEGAGSTPRAGGAAPGEPQPPVEEGEVRYVEIEDLGKQGDG
ncbi:MAG: deoxyribonuclease, partial [Halobacteriaceae archaeon]